MSMDSYDYIMTGNSCENNQRIEKLEQTCAELEHLISDLWQCAGCPCCSECDHDDDDECKLNLHFRYKRAMNWRKRVPNA